jgi:hypothetical protein
MMVRANSCYYAQWEYRAKLDLRLDYFYESSSQEGVETKRPPPKSCQAYGEDIVQRVGKLTQI